MFFSVLAAKEFKIPCALFWTASACGYLGYLKIPELIKQGLVPLQGMVFHISLVEMSGNFCTFYSRNDLVLKFSRFCNNFVFLYFKIWLENIFVRCAFVERMIYSLNFSLLRFRLRILSNL